MLQIKKLLKQLVLDYPDISFVSESGFKWSAATQTIHYDASFKNAVSLTLHELAHAILEHEDMGLDIELIKKERLAWEYAASHLAPTYGLVITENEIEDAMDTYRDWLHGKSTCPDCQANALQTKNGTYKCSACGCQWRANDARVTGLKRYRLKTSV